jgi:hypothetical protein
VRGPDHSPDHSERESRSKGSSNSGGAEGIEAGVGCKMCHMFPNHLLPVSLLNWALVSQSSLTFNSIYQLCYQRRFRDDNVFGMGWGEMDCNVLSSGLL